MSCSIGFPESPEDPSTEVELSPEHAEFDGDHPSAYAYASVAGPDSGYTTISSYWETMAPLNATSAVSI